MNSIEQLPKEITEKTYDRMAPNYLEDAVAEWLEVLTDDSMIPTWDGKVRNRSEIWINDGEIVLVMYKAKCPVCNRWFATLTYDDCSSAYDHCYHCNSDLQH